MDITVSCASGVEKTLKSELVRLGYPMSPAENGKITFNGSFLDVARCNINLRTADRVYIKLGEFKAETFDQLFDGVRAIDFKEIFPKDALVVVNGKCAKSKLFSVSACQSIVKKAVSVKMCEQYGVCMLVETGETYRLDFHIYKDTVEILLNTSGIGLHKRGYRNLVGIAPIKETLASALILMSDYYYERPFADPFCGSGTFLIEAGMIALDIAPGLHRTFDLNGWKNFDKRFYQTALEEARDKIKRDRKIEIFGSDIDKKAIFLTKEHLKRVKLDGKINVKVSGVKDFTTELKNGTIVTNPPYGERVYDKEDATLCYRQLGEAVSKLNGWSTFVITGANGFEKNFGKKADRTKKIFNSNKECKYYFYYGKKENSNG